MSRIGNPLDIHLLVDIILLWVVLRLQLWLQPDIDHADTKRWYKAYLLAQLP